MMRQDIRLCLCCPNNIPIHLLSINPELELVLELPAASDLFGASIHLCNRQQSSSFAM